MPILPGDELTGDCQYVGNTPIQPHKEADGLLARATAADLDAVSDDVEVIRTGMVILSSRKQAYIDAYAALDLGVCDEDDATFAAENAPLMIRFESAGGLQVWLTGRDFIDYVQGAGVEYWQLAFDRVVAYAKAHVAAERTKIVFLEGAGFSGAGPRLLSTYFPNCTTKGDWTLHLMDELHGTFGQMVTSYFAGNGGGGSGTNRESATPAETAVLIIDHIFAPAFDDLGSIYQVLIDNVSVIRGILVAGGGLIAWSEVYLDDPNTVGEPTPPALVYGWSWLPRPLPGIIPGSLGTRLNPWVATEDGERLIPGMTASINNAADSAQSAFSGNLNGLVVLATTGSGSPGLGPPGTYDIEIGGVPTL